MSKETSIKDLSAIIVKAISEEPYFSKDVLIPKVKSLISGFRLKTASLNYNSLENPSKTAKLMRSYELQVEEKKYWKNELINIVGAENMEYYYKKLSDSQQ